MNPKKVDNNPNRIASYIITTTVSCPSQIKSELVKTINKLYLGDEHVNTINSDWQIVEKEWVATHPNKNIVDEIHKKIHAVQTVKLKVTFFSDGSRTYEVEK